jgi:hypothetical protein
VAPVVRNVKKKKSIFRWIEEKVHLTSLLLEVSQKIKFDTKSKGEIYLTRQACTCDVTLWLVRLMFIPPRPSQEPRTISSEKSDYEKTYLVLQFKCLIFLPYFKQIWDSSADCHRSPHIKFYLIRTAAGTCGQTDRRKKDRGLMD